VPRIEITFETWPSSKFSAAMVCLWRSGRWGTAAGPARCARKEVWIS